MVPSETKADLLRRAETCVGEAKALGADPAEVAHALAWIYDERGESGRAIPYYEEALRCTADEDGDLKYNYAVALAKTSREQEALQVLEKVPSSVVVWAETDPDLDTLRAPAWQAALDAILKRAKANLEDAPTPR